jgi:hypothetical protein
VPTELIEQIKNWGWLAVLIVLIAAGNRKIWVYGWMLTESEARWEKRLEKEEERTRRWQEEAETIARLAQQSLEEAKARRR